MARAIHSPGMAALSQQRCFNHSLREAVARCPECARFYCRECITEHEDRVVCAVCLRKSARAPFTPRTGLAVALRGLLVLGGVTVVWLFFHLLGQTLLSVPSAFHDGTVWKPKWIDQ